MGSTMTDKTEAQPEALRLADALAQADRAEAAAINYGEGTTLGIEAYASAKTIRALHAEIQQLKAQPSARQAAPDGWRLVPVEPTDAMLLTLASDGEAEVIAKHPEWHPMLLDRSGVPQRYAAMLSAAPPPPEREPQKGVLDD